MNLLNLWITSYYLKGEYVYSVRAGTETLYRGRWSKSKTLALDDAKRWLYTIMDNAEVVAANDKDNVYLIKTHAMNEWKLPDKPIYLLATKTPSGELAVYHVLSSTETEDPKL